MEAMFGGRYVNFFFCAGVTSISCPSASNTLSVWLKKRGWKVILKDMTCDLTDTRWMGTPILTAVSKSGISISEFNEWKLASAAFESEAIGMRDHHKSLRAAVCHYFRERLPILQRLHQASARKNKPVQDVDTYLKDLGKDGCWGDVQCKMALGAMSDGPLCTYEVIFTTEKGQVYSRLSGPTLTQGTDSRPSQNTLYIVFSRSESHFYAAIPIKNVEESIAYYPTLCRKNSLIVVDDHKKGFYLHNVLADGNCMFRAFTFAATAHRKLEEIIKRTIRVSIMQPQPQDIPMEFMNHKMVNM